MAPRFSATVRTMLTFINVSTAHKASGLHRAQTPTSRMLQTDSGLHPKLLARTISLPIPRMLSRSSSSRVVVHSVYWPWKMSRVRTMSIMNPVPPSNPDNRTADTPLPRNVRDPDEDEGPLATEWPQKAESSKTLVLCLDGTGGEYDDDEASTQTSCDTIIDTDAGISRPTLLGFLAVLPKTIPVRWCTTGYAIYLSRIYRQGAHGMHYPPRLIDGRRYYGYSFAFLAHFSVDGPTIRSSHSVVLRLARMFLAITQIVQGTFA